MKFKQMTDIIFKKIDKNNTGFIKSFILKKLLKKHVNTSN